jgi:predicted dehydrogenase
MELHKGMTRRGFIHSASAYAVGGALLPGRLFRSSDPMRRLRVAVVGTGHRGSGMWGKDVVKDYNDLVEFVGLCDANAGRVEYVRKFIGAGCPAFTDFEAMVRQTAPDVVIVTTVDGTHHTYIARAMELGCDVITEKPLTTDETKLKMVLDAYRKHGKTIVVAFNYRYTPHRAKIKELLMQERIGRVTSVDFHWYLDVYHGADYFRRWHRLRAAGGSLLVHKATHHFDLLNWWIGSEPVVVHAFGELEFYGRNNSFRHTHCRPCPHNERCKFFFDLTKDSHLMSLYAAHEQHDGYHRDGCVWREDIDIFDKMAVQIKYANKVQVSYSLTTYSPYEGYRIAFNGTKGRLDAWVHERQPWASDPFEEIRITDNFGKTELMRIPQVKGGHGGGDGLLKERIFKNPRAADPLQQAAGLREGALSVLVGIAARNSIDSGLPVRISDLANLDL